MSKALQESRMIGDIYALAYCCSQPAQQMTLHKALRDLVSEELIWVVGEQPASTAHAMTIGKVIQHGALRAERLREAQTAAGITSLEASLEGNGRESLRILSKVLNGDPSIPRVQHYCAGCCASREEACERVCAAVIQSGMLGKFLLPAKHRWGSLGEALGQMLPGFVMHKLLPRTFARAFQKTKTMHRASDEDDDDEDLILTDKQKSAIWGTLSS
eukprot:758474-Amphidinium_carterae.2